MAGLGLWPSADSEAPRIRDDRGRLRGRCPVELSLSLSLDSPSIETLGSQNCPRRTTEKNNGHRDVKNAVSRNGPAPQKTSPVGTAPERTRLGGYDMKSTSPRTLRLALAAATLGGFAALSGVGATVASAAPARGGVGSVYIATNATSGNSVQVFSRQANGTLVAGGSYATGGLGT